MNNEAWIFGYGSLIGNPGFSFINRRVGYIRGWARRFYQGSTDHRGIPESPGRVVTLVADPEAMCWGVAYQVTRDALAAVFSYLDHREKGGFSRQCVDFYSQADGYLHPVSNVYVYVADENNPEYLGPAPMSDIAQQIFHSHGPSGSNREYLFQLADSLRTIGVIDEHVFALEEQVRLLGASDKFNLADQTQSRRRLKEN